MPRASRIKTKDGKLNLVGPQVRARRIFRGDTRDSVCARIQVNTGVEWGINERDLWKIENQRRACTDLEIVELAKALSCTVADLFNGRAPQY